jgi:hypothetical protein
MLGRNGLCAACVILMVAIAWRDAAGAEPPAASPLRNWLVQLNDDDYAVREEAARQLTEAGAAAIPELVEGLASDQAEVSWRCGHLSKSAWLGTMQSSRS